MAGPVHTADVPRVSIAWLAREWNTGLSERTFIERAVLFVHEQGRRRLWWFADCGFVRLPDFFCVIDQPDRPDLVEWIRDRIAERILFGRSEICELAARLGISPPPNFDKWAAANDCSGQQPAQPPPTPEPLTREQAVATIIAAGKEPSSRGYPWKDAEEDVRRLCAVGGDARGYDRRTLRGVFAREKAKSSSG